MNIIKLPIHIIILVGFTVFFAACGGGSDSDDDGNVKLCGGLLGLQCNSDEYCNFTDLSCGAADQTGRCDGVPEVCTEIYAPVCGCDDRTYGNACEAAGAGVSIVKNGEC